MIIDIRYLNAAPTQIQRVRMISAYICPDGTAMPELVIHSKDYTPQINIDMETIVSFTITED